MSGDGVDRPGGWVDGIGWVALFTELPEGTCYVNRLGGPEGVEDKRSIRGADQRFPAIITRWPDGSDPTPAPAAPPEADSAAETLERIRQIVAETVAAMDDESTQPASYTAADGFDEVAALVAAPTPGEGEAP